MPKNVDPMKFWATCVSISVSTRNFLKKKKNKPTKPTNHMGADQSNQPNLTQLNPT